MLLFMYHRRIMTLEEILKLSVQKGASDVHLKAGVAPVIRRHGALRPINPKEPPLNAEELEVMARQIMDATQWAHFEKHYEIDLGYGIAGVARFRVNVFRQRGTVRMVIRNIPHKIPTLNDLTLPAVVAKMAHFERGMVLITGVAGSGKSSTLAAILNEINQTYNKHILTIEDPIEFLIRDKKSLITQREIGVDTQTFSQALRSGLRQDPDVILIGEMRDRETIEIALTAAETGHLVFSSLHTLDASETINRILSSFETERHPQLRLQLGSTLKAVISQRLCRRKDESGFIPAVEILINTPRIRDLIEMPEKSGSIQEHIEEGRSAWGMQSFNQSLMELLDLELISFEEALLHSSRPEEFRVRSQGITAMDGKKWANANKSEKHGNEWQAIDEVDLDIQTQAKKKA
jgi:twitching motility protein PilT